MNRPILRFSVELWRSILNKFLFFLVTFYFGFAVAAPSAPVVSVPAVSEVTTEERIAPSDLEGFRRGCFLAADNQLPQTSKAKYCDCFKDKMAKTMSAIEYREYSTRIAKSTGTSGARMLDNTFKAAENKMTEFVTECSALLEMEPPYKVSK